MVLVRHLTLPYEVRPFIRRCGNVACNCAVAIRSGDDIILIDSCGPRDAPYAAGTLVVRFYLNGDLTPGTSLHQYDDGLKYEVYMVVYSMMSSQRWSCRSPLSNTKVAVWYFLMFINIYVLVKFSTACGIMVDICIRIGNDYLKIRMCRHILTIYIYYILPC